MDATTPLRELRFAGIDFESAGAQKGSTDVPVQIGLAEWSLTEGHARGFVSYLRADRPVTWSARKVHGIRDENLAGAPLLPELWPTVRSHLSDAVVVAHGKGTEKRFLRAFPGHGFGPWVDTLLLARSAWPELSGHSLSAACEACGVTPRVAELVPGRRWHDALYDTVASLVLLEQIIIRFELEDAPLHLLLEPDTSRWRRLR